MATNGEQQTSPMRYTCTSVVIDGIPPRGFFKSKGKYFLRITVEGGKGWESREVQTKAGRVTWDEERDKYDVECLATSALDVKLWKRHTSRPEEEVGSLERTVQDWLESTQSLALVLASTQTIKTSIFITLHIQQVGNAPPSAKPVDAIQETIDKAQTDANALRALPGLSTVQVGIDVANGAQEPVTEITEIWEPLLENVDWFMKAMDVVSEVHPYAKTAWAVLSAAYKAVKAQQARDSQVMDLVDKMKEIYEFVREARQLDEIKSHPGTDTLREKALVRLSTQTIECGHFISTYAKDRNFLIRLLKQTTTSKGDAISNYMDSFQKIKDAFWDGSALSIELVTFRMMGKLETLASKADVEKIPYVIEASYDKAKQCLPGTRVALLDELTAWVNEDETDAGKVRVLMGSAGTGKSAIAHTLAKRFDAMGQLGSMFCFSTSERANRTPASVFRNIARDLCKGRPAFRDALAASIEDDMSTCGTNDLELQFAEFIAKPAKELSLSGTVLIIIEALDESASDRERARLVSFLMRRLGDSLPPGFCVLITCRPEPDIISALKRKPETLSIREMPTPDREKTLQSDILLYVRYQLSEGSNVLPDDLDEECCHELVKRAEGLFQWAFVACDYIIGRYSFGETERMRYEKLLEGTEEAVTLDSLYITVLQEYTRSKDSIAPFKITMGIVLMAVEPLTMRSLREVMRRIPADEGLRPGVLQQNTILPLLGSLLSGVMQEDMPVRPLHSSFREVLCDERRGGPFYIGRGGHHDRFTVASLQLLKDGLHFNMGNLRTSYRPHRDLLSAVALSKAVPPELLYACKYWGSHLSECMDDFGSYFGMLSSLVRDLFTKNLLFWIEAGSISGTVAALSSALASAQGRLQAFGEDVQDIGFDAAQFIRRFGPVLVECAPHLYLSALLWCPSRCRLVHEYRQAYRDRVHIASTWASSWPVLELSLFGHKRNVNAVAFTPDGTLIVSGSDDRSIRIWNAATGEPVGSPMAGHERLINSITVSPDGMLVASGSDDQTVRLWSVATGEMVGEPMSGHTHVVKSVAFSHDGRQIVSGSRDGTVRVWDTATGRLVGEPITGHTDTVFSVAFSPDDKQIVSGSDDGTVRVWNSVTRATVARSTGRQRGGIVSVAFSPDGMRIAAGSRDKTIQILNAQSGEMARKPLRGHMHEVSAVTFSNDGTRIVSGSWDNTVRIWGATTGKPVGTPLTDHTGCVTSVAFSNDSKRIVSAACDRTVRVWNATTPTTMHQARKGHKNLVRSIAFSPDDKRIVTASDDRTLRVWDALTGEMVGEPLAGQEDRINTVVYSPDGTLIASGSQDKTLLIWDSETGEALDELTDGDMGAIHALCFSPDGTLLVSGSDDNTVHLWDTSTGEMKGIPMKGHEKAVASVAFSHDGKQVMSGSADHELRVWNVETQEPLGRPKSYRGRTAMFGAISNDGTRMVWGSGDESVRVWTAATGEVVGRPADPNGPERSAGMLEKIGMLRGTPWVHPVAFSPDGTRIVSGFDRMVRVWDAATGEQLGKPFAGHTDDVTSVAFSHDGTRIASGAEDNTVRVWNATPVSVSPLSDEIANKQMLERENSKSIVYLASPPCLLNQSISCNRRIKPSQMPGCAYPWIMRPDGSSETARIVCSGYRRISRAPCILGRRSW